jgi:hypothetical protein
LAENQGVGGFPKIAKAEYGSPSKSQADARPGWKFNDPATSAIKHLPSEQLSAFPTNPLAEINRGAYCPTSEAYDQADVSKADSSES